MLKDELKSQHKTNKDLRFKIYESKQPLCKAIEKLLLEYTKETGLEITELTIYANNMIKSYSVNATVEGEG